MMFYEWIFPEKFSNEDFMGNSKFFFDFLSGLSHQELPWGHIGACTPTLGNFGHI